MQNKSRDTGFRDPKKHELVIWMADANQSLDLNCVPCETPFKDWISSAFSAERITHVYIYCIILYGAARTQWGWKCGCESGAHENERLISHAERWTGGRLEWCALESTAGGVDTLATEPPVSSRSGLIIKSDISHQSFSLIPDVRRPPTECLGTITAASARLSQLATLFAARRAPPTFYYYVIMYTPFFCLFPNTSPATFFAAPSCTVLPSGVSRRTQFNVLVPSYNNANATPPSL